MTRRSRLLLICASAVIGVGALVSLIFISSEPYAKISMAAVAISMLLVMSSQLAIYRSRGSHE